MSTSQKTMCLVLMMCKSLLSRLSRVQAFHFEPNFSYILSVSSCALCPAPSKKNETWHHHSMHTTPQPPLHTHPQDMIPALSLCEVRPPPHFFFFCLSNKRLVDESLCLVCFAHVFGGGGGSSKQQQQAAAEAEAARSAQTRARWRSAAILARVRV